MSEGAGVASRRLRRSDRFPYAFKTHQEILPRSGILSDFPALQSRRFTPRPEAEGTETPPRFTPLCVY